MGESRLPKIKKSVRKLIAKKWAEIKQLKLPKPVYIKVAPSQIPRKVRKKEGYPLYEQYRQ